MDTQTKQIVLAENRELSPTVWGLIKEMGPAMHASRLFGVASPEAAMAIMLKGYEMGLGFATSFELIQVVQGKPSLSPRGALALLHNSPKIEAIDIQRLVDDKGDFVGYSCTMRRTNGFEYTATWTMDDARRAGLVKPGSGWENYPENMCLWRAVGFAADVVAPDITAGMTGLMKMPERYGVALSEQGDVIDADPLQLAENAGATAADWNPKTSVSLQGLIDLVGLDRVMEANGGTLPTMPDEIEAVAMALIGS